MAGRSFSTTLPECHLATATYLENVEDYRAAQGYSALTVSLTSRRLRLFPGPRLRYWVALGQRQTQAVARQS